MNQGPVNATEALAMLKDGNARFVDGDRCIDTYRSHTKLEEHLEGQAPFAIVLGCSDSRVPVEIIFDAGLGDLFVIRVAGNTQTTDSRLFTNKVSDTFSCTRFDGVD